MPLVVLVGEAYGDEEVRVNTPFVGAAGRLLDGVLVEVGLRREDCLVWNLLMEQPTPSGATSAIRNDFGALYVDPKRIRPTERLLNALERLDAEVAASHATVVVALGAEALRWLTGQREIGHWRGSVLPYALPTVLGENGREGSGERARGGPSKVLPTYHPAAILRQWAWRPLLVHDLGKALEQAAFPEMRQAARTVTVCLPNVMPLCWATMAPSCPDLYRTAIQTQQGLDRALEALQGLAGGPPVAFDIEVERQQPNSIAFARAGEAALVIPFFRGESGSLWAPAEEVRLWEEIRRLFQTTPLLGQNVAYDLAFLGEVDIWPAHLTLDTMVAFHVLYPELPKGLEFLASLYTDLPYYKHLIEDPNPYVFWAYNGLDAMITWACGQAIAQELRES